MVLVAGYIIEKVSGVPYNDYIKRKILELFRMNGSGIRKEDVDTTLLAKAYIYSKKFLTFKLVYTRPAAALLSSSSDMAKFMQMLLNRGEVVTKAFLQNNSIHIVYG